MARGSVAGRECDRFEEHARVLLSQHLGVHLEKGKVNGIPKEWDMLYGRAQARGRVVGDAKYLTLVKGEGYPSAKFTEISAHVWMLQKMKAATKFLVFGNDRRVPERWLKKYSRLADGVTFFFVAGDEVERLFPNEHVA